MSAASASASLSPRTPRTTRASLTGLMRTCFILQECEGAAAALLGHLSAFLLRVSSAVCAFPVLPAHRHTQSSVCVCVYIYICLSLRFFVSLQVLYSRTRLFCPRVSLPPPLCVCALALVLERGGGGNREGLFARSSGRARERLSFGFLLSKEYQANQIQENQRVTKKSCLKCV